MKTTTQITAAQEVLLAAEDLATANRTPFTEWDLTVAAWKRNRNRFGCRGYEDVYPDHKRVMMEIMGKTKRDNPIRRQFLRKLRKNYYEMTSLGRAEAARLESGAAGGGSHSGDVRSPGPVFDAVEPYANDRAFRAWRQNPEEPRTWLGAATFLHLAKNDPNELNDRIRAAETAVRQALQWCDQNSKDLLPRGTHGGGAITREDLEGLQAFIKLIEARFARQIDAIRAKGA